MAYLPLTRVNVLLRDTIRDMFNPMVRSTIEEDATIRRYFTTLSAAGGQYYDLNNNYELTGDFELHLDFSDANAGAAGGFTVLFGNSTSNDDYLTITGTGALRLNIDNTAIFTSADIVVNSNLCTIVLIRSGSVITCYYNGAVIASGTSSNGISLRYVGRRFGGQYFSGIMANFKVWTGGDRTTGTQIIDMPLDENWVSGTVAHNRAGAINATAVNITSADAELYTFNATDNEWVGDTSGNILPVAG